MLSSHSLNAIKATDAPKHDAKFYTTCFAGGVLSCGTTHTAICPLDLVKCRRQTNPGMYKSLWDGLQQAVLVAAGHLSGGEFDVDEIPAQGAGQGLFQ